MLTLYYSPGACSMASHIALEETGASYDTKLVALAKGEQRSEAYLRINPRGRVPALRVDDAVLTENVAILSYLAKRFPEARLLPPDPFAEARCISTMAWFSNNVHPSFTHINRPERFAEDTAVRDKLKETGRKNFWANCQEIDAMLKGKDWMMGGQYTVCDPYALVFYGWGTRINLPMKELAGYTAFKEGDAAAAGGPQDPRARADPTAGNCAHLNRQRDIFYGAGTSREGIFCGPFSRVEERVRAKFFSRTAQRHWRWPLLPIPTRETCITPSIAAIW